MNRRIISICCFVLLAFPLLWAQIPTKEKTGQGRNTTIILDSPVTVSSGIDTSKVDSIPVVPDSVVLTESSKADSDTIVLEKQDIPTDQKSDVIQKRPAISGIMKEYFILKLKVNDDGSSYKLDTVSILYEKYLGALNYLNDPSTPERYLANDPDYFRMFVPFTYYMRPMEHYSKVNWKFTGGENHVAKYPVLLHIDSLVFTSKKRANSIVDRAMLAAYVNRPDLIVRTEKEIDEARAFDDNIEEEVSRHRRSPLKQFTSEGIEYVKRKKPGVVLHKPNWWVTGGSGSLNFAQNHYSKNWYTGGSSTHSLLATLQLKANYNDNEKIQWENLLDTKLGFISSPSDEYHKYLVNNDQLRIYSKLGIQAISNWYYTISTELKTQFCKAYNSNSETVKAAFLAPADWSTSIGMDYKLNKSQLNLSVFIAPLTHTMRYMGNADVNEVDYGLDEGKSVKHDFGSQVQTNLTWNVFSFVTVTSRLDYLTSYEWVRIEWENKLNFRLNSFISASLYVFGRFDDGNTPTYGSSYFQVNETFGLGLNYSW